MCLLEQDGMSQHRLERKLARQAFPCLCHGTIQGSHSGHWDMCIAGVRHFLFLFQPYRDPISPYMLEYSRIGDGIVVLISRIAHKRAHHQDGPLLMYQHTC